MLRKQLGSSTHLRTFSCQSGVLGVKVELNSKTRKCQTQREFIAQPSLHWCLHLLAALFRMMSGVSKRSTGVVYVVEQAPQA